MKPKVATMRALIAYTAVRALGMATIIVALVIAVVLLIIWALAYYLSPWWWLFLLPISFAVIAAIVLHVVITRIIHLIHRHPFTESQRHALEAFTAKVVRLAEFRSMPVPAYAFLMLRDLIRYQDAKTLRDALADSSSLTKDFSDLEKYFGER